MNLSKMTILSFEIGPGCNLKEEHQKCPINRRTFNKTFGALTTNDIVNAISDAEFLGFDGYVAFHYYNEPLLYQERIKEVIEKKPDTKYLLWTNGLLLSEKVEENHIISLFDKVVITCYFEDKLLFFQNLKEHYGNIQIQQWELDDRLDIYSRQHSNIVGCRRVQWELPIDYFGNIHLCCRDWDNSHYIGNIKDKSFREILQSDIYMNTIEAVSGSKLLDLRCAPEICKKCDEPWLRVPVL